MNSVVRDGAGKTTGCSYILLKPQNQASFLSNYETESVYKYNCIDLSYLINSFLFFSAKELPVRETDLFVSHLNS